jgi:uncharacterized protein (DUF4415 family)
MTQEIKVEEVKPVLEKKQVVISEHKKQIIKPILEIKKQEVTTEHKETVKQVKPIEHKELRKTLTLTIDAKVLEVLKARADRQHLSMSRINEEILREKFRLP